MEIKTASTEKDFLQIRKIWEERFTTDSIWLNTFFRQILPLCRSFIYYIEHKSVSILSLMPINYSYPSMDNNSGSCIGNGKLKGYYLFGVATRKGEEGKKYAAQLIMHVSNLLIREGYDFIFERPAYQSLNKYYFNLGFTISIPKIPHTFPSMENICSPENNHKVSNVKTASKAILESIRTEHPYRFEWENTKLLEGLLELGELEEHIRAYTPSPNPEETYIAVKTLRALNPKIFSNAFFCFPME